MIVPLRNSDKVALIDDEDFDKIKAYSWDLHQAGYAYSRFWNGSGYTTVYMHRLVLNAPKGTEVDHKEQQARLDNRKQNLRLCTHAQNMAHLRLTREHTSRFRGVSKFPRDDRWVAHVRISGKSKYLGLFEDEIEAAKAYDAAATTAFGEFAVLNFYVPSRR